MAFIGIGTLILFFVLMALGAIVEGRDTSKVEIDRLADKSRQNALKRPIKRNVKYAKYWMMGGKLNG